MILVNKKGFMVRHFIPEQGWRAYACADVASLKHLVNKLTGRELSTYAVDSSYNLITKELAIQSGFHVYRDSRGR